MLAFFRGHFKGSERFSAHYMVGGDNFIVVDKDAELIKNSKGDGVTNFHTLKRIAYHYNCKVVLAADNYALVKMTPNLFLEARDRIYAKKHDPYALYERLCEGNKNAELNISQRSPVAMKWNS